MRRGLYHFWCGFAVVILLASAVVHVSTFFGVDPMQVIPWVFALHVLIFLAFGAGLVYAGKAEPDRKRQFRVLLYTPRWGLLLGAVCFLYAFVNFAAVFGRHEWGIAEQRGGKYVLMNKGKFIRELNEAQYHRQRALMVRAFSGHWMLFSSVGLAFLLGAGKLRQEQESEAKAFASG